MNTAQVNKVADFVGRVALIALFATMAFSQTRAVIHIFAQSDSVSWLDLGNRLAGLAFVMLVVGLTIVRLEPIRSAAGFEPRLSALAGTFLCTLLVALPPSEIGMPLRLTSLVLTAAGGLLSIYVLLWLGRAFSIMAQARRLITTGPYAIVRHPLYLCEAIMTVGVALAHLSLTAVLIVAIQWMFQLRRMSNEEKVLEAAFPESVAYAARTPRIIPRLFHVQRRLLFRSGRNHLITIRHLSSQSYD